MSDRTLGLLVLVVGLAILLRLFTAGSFIFFIIAAVLALAAASGMMGREGYVLAAIFLLLAFTGAALSTALFAVRMLVRLAPILLVLAGIYLFVRSFSRS